MKNRYKKASLKIARRRKARKYVGRIFKISMAAAFLAGIIFVLRADFLQVADFEVSGTEIVSADSIKNTAAGFASGTGFFLVPKSNILFLNNQKLASVLMSEFPRLSKVEVNKNFFNRRIDLKTTERKDDFLWCSQEECFFMTEDGLVFERALPGNPRGKIVFRGILEGDPLLKNFASSEEMKNYLKFIEILKGEGFEIFSLDIESGDKGLVVSNMGDIIFNPEEKDLSAVAQNITLLINEIKSKTPSARFQYIDARFGNKIFYKLI